MGYLDQKLWDIQLDILVKNCWIYLAKVWDIFGKTMGYIGQTFFDIFGKPMG